ncbi:MAG TPA: hypothetical protein VIZ91_11270 [Solirubrobacterales bacterium]
MFGTIEDVGAVAGIASFLAMSGLLVLYLIRARELRKLRRATPFLVQVGNGQRGRARSRRAAARAGRRGAGTR